MDGNKLKYDLEERTTKFGINIILFCKKINVNIITKPLINQIIKSGTSVGANYMEAIGANSKNDFRYKIFICKKESQETKHWLRMLSAADNDLKGSADILLKEAHELTLIFHKIAKSSSKNNDTVI